MFPPSPTDGQTFEDGSNRYQYGAVNNEWLMVPLHAGGTSATGPQLDTLTDGSDADSLHAHTNVAAHAIASHSDTSATGAEMETLTSGGNADALHAHAAPAIAHLATTGQGTDDHHPQLHTVASHSDTSATGAELNTLTDGSNADDLHNHSGGVGFTPHSAYIENAASADVNNAVVLTNVSFWDPATLEQTAGAGYTALAGGVTVPDTGVYLVSGNVYYTGGVRVSVGMKVSVAGVPRGSLRAPAYVRFASGQNRASVTMSTLRVEANAGDVISFMKLRDSTTTTASPCAAGDADMTIVKTL